MLQRVWIVLGAVVLLSVAPAWAVDSDGDGITDDLDNCPDVTNPDQADNEDQGPPFAQWAESAWASTEWSTGDWSAAQTTGPPESPGVCAEMPTAWSPATDADFDEWVELIFPNPVYAEGVHVVESWIGGFVSAVELRDTSGVLHPAWSGADDTPCGGVLALTWPSTSYLATRARVHTRAPGWEQIDAVALIGRRKSDGVGDACDVCPSIYDPTQPDSDLDGVGDACDNCSHASNPEQADGDADRFGDTCDNCPGVANFGQEDWDDDGVGDLCDNCPQDSNAAQQDIDRNGVGDVCNDFEDADDDDFADALDNCPAVANAGQQDRDGNGVGNACNGFEDADDDDFADALDNCPAVANAGQQDRDGNGVGDGCNDFEDTDGDDFADILDNCSAVANFRQWDQDFDGIGDICDSCLFSSSNDCTTRTVCADGCDHQSIQAAVDAADDGDVIDIGPGTFIESLQVYRPIELRGHGADQTVIRSPGITAVTISGGQISHVLIEDSNVGVNLLRGTIRNSTIRGNEAGISAGIVGRGRVVDCLITGNGPQAAVELFDGSMSGCSIMDNQGLGLRANTTSFVEVLNSTIAGNAAGAEILADARTVGHDGCGFVEGSITLRGNTVFGNDGAGIFASIGTVCCPPGGGGNQGLSSASNDTEATALWPWGCANGHIVVSNNILADNGDNWDGSPGGPGPGGPPIGLRFPFRCSHNLLSDADPSFPTHVCQGPTFLDADPLLLSLSDNGGPTPTFAPAQGSPAIDAGGDYCVPTDQRGTVRPQDGDGDGIAKCDIGAYEVDVWTVGIDIKPDAFPNSVNPHSRGVTPVAILGRETFDVAEIDVTTLAFGPGGAPIAHRHGHLQDTNYDGIMDLMLHFRTQENGIACGDESATLTGETLDGQHFEGSDSIVTVGCRRSERPWPWMRDERRVVEPRGEAVIDLERK